MFKSNFFVFILILIFRLLGVFVIQTSFVPDEYWQSLEVAHKLTFGYGHLTWEWKKRIRSYVYPLIFHVLYCILPDATEVMVLAPKIFQAVLSAIGDFYVYKLSVKLFGENCGYWTIFNLLSSWFLFYCSSRTLTNMAEASLTCVGLYFYPWRRKDLRLEYNYLWFTGASALVRPTAVILWLPLYVWHIWREKSILNSLKKAFCIGFIFLTGLAVCDRWCYGQWILTPINFFLFNWSIDIGALYGVHNFSWYFTVGLPTVLSVHIFPFVMGIFLPQLKPLYLLVLWVICILSVPSHKEFRFLLPVMHLTILSSSVVMNAISSGRFYICGLKVKRKLNFLIVCSILLVNIPLSIYMGLFHQRGVIDVTYYLSQDLNKTSSVLFLMPCHSTPYYSYIHKNVPMRFLTCEPNFQRNEGYVDEADEFFANPLEWLSNNYAVNHSNPLPSHLVMFDAAYSNVSNFLENYNYELCFATFHSHFPEKRTGKFVHVYCRM